MDANRDIPIDVEIEQVLLGSMMSDNAVIENAAALPTEALYDPLHQRIFAHILQSRAAGPGTISALTVHADLKADAGLMEVGGADYLRGLEKAAPALPNVQSFVRILNDLAARRELLRIGENLVNTAYEATEDGALAQQIQLAREAFDRVAVVGRNGAPDAPILSSADFVTGFAPPDYLADGVIQRGFLYSNTAPTGAGKTSIMLRFMAHVALGRQFAGHDVECGRCLMLVGENPDDVRVRWIALGENMGFAPEEIDVHFMPGVFSIAAALPRIRERVTLLGGVALILVDTSAAYFEGDDENSNKQLGDHARGLRELTAMPGNPSVVANCHPAKSARDDNLLPRGGGAFLAEVDGNLTCARKDGSVEMHWQGKFRGPDFEPMSFEMITVTSATLRTKRGREIKTVYARPLSDVEQRERADAANNDLQRLLGVMAEHEGASIAELATAGGWVSASGPQKSTVSRLLGNLKTQKMGTKELGRWALTPSGERTAKRGKNG